MARRTSSSFFDRNDAGLRINRFNNARPVGKWSHKTNLYDADNLVEYSENTNSYRNLGLIKKVRNVNSERARRISSYNFLINNGEI